MLRVFSIATVCALLLPLATAYAQPGVSRADGDQAAAQVNDQDNRPPVASPDAIPAAPTLVIPSHMAPNAAPSAGEATTTSNAASDTADESAGDTANNATADTGLPPPIAGSLPYLGVAVQYIESRDQPGRTVEGLEVMSVDPDSPADRAGIKGRTAMSTLGATGATAGELMAPLNLIVMPLLHHSGQLGQDGDLIVALDDQRVQSRYDLEAKLAKLRPGDTLYVTVQRTLKDGSITTLKLPVRLGKPDQVATTQSAPNQSPARALSASPSH